MEPFQQKNVAFCLLFILSYHSQCPPVLFTPATEHDIVVNIKLILMICVVNFYIFFLPIDVRIHCTKSCTFKALLLHRRQYPYTSATWKFDKNRSRMGVDDGELMRFDLSVTPCIYSKYVSCTMFGHFLLPVMLRESAKLNDGCCI